jgi:hypothetical protein
MVYGGFGIDLKQRSKMLRRTVILAQTVEHNHVFPSFRKLVFDLVSASLVSKKLLNNIVCPFIKQW